MDSVSFQVSVSTTAAAAACASSYVSRIEPETSMTITTFLGPDAAAEYLAMVGGTRADGPDSVENRGRNWGKHGWRLAGRALRGAANEGGRA